MQSTFCQELPLSQGLPCTVSVQIIRKTQQLSILEINMEIRNLQWV